MEAKISNISPSIVKDSQGLNTIKTILTLEGGAAGSFSVPSGESTSGFEALAKDPEVAISNINAVKSYLIGKSFTPDGLDRYLIQLDGSENKSKLGANAILSISIAFFQALAVSAKRSTYSLIAEYIGNTAKLRIPRLMINLMEGGKHAHNSIDLQEFLFIPKGTSVEKNLVNAGLILDRIKMKFSTEVSQAHEGGVSINRLMKNEEALSIFHEVVKSVSNDADLGIDVAANSFKKGADYYISDSTSALSAQDLTDFYKRVLTKYPILTLEDPFSEDEWAAWETLRTTLGGVTQLIGDDLTSTNPERLEHAISIGAIDGLIVKPNQIGTLSETLQVVKRAQSAGLSIIVSHRARETEDNFIADLAVGVGADFLKSGAPTQKERLAKYQRLSMIESEL